MTEQRHANLGIHPVHAAGEHDPHEHVQRRAIAHRMRTIAIVVAVLLAAGAARTLVSRGANARELQAAVAEQSVVYVKTTLPRPAGAGQAPIAARATGYVKRWTKDIGSHVEKGELLAEIEAPEIDEQVRQATATR